MTFPVKVVGKQLVIDDRRTTTSGRGGASGKYQFTGKSCNPACDR